MENYRVQLEPLQREQYRQVAEWAYGPQGDSMDWDRHAAEMNEPRWLHFGIYQRGEFVGCLSIEKISDDAAEYHVATMSRRVHPRRLAELLVSTADYLFSHGFTRLTASVPRKSRASARLAIRCGMRETARDDSFRRFVLTKQEPDYANSAA